MSQKVIEFPRGFCYTSREVVGMDKLHPYMKIVDGIFKKKSAMTADEDSLTVFYRTTDNKLLSESFDDGATVDDQCGIKELRFLLSAFEEMDVSITTNKFNAVFGFTFQRLKPNVKIPAVFEYPNQSAQRRPSYYDKPLTVFDLFSEPEELPNVNLSGFSKLKSLRKSIDQSLGVFGFQSDELEAPMVDCEDEVMERYINFGFSTQRVFRFTDKRLAVFQKAINTTNEFNFMINRYDEGYVLSFGFCVNDVRF